MTDDLATGLLRFYQARAMVNDVFLPGRSVRPKSIPLVPPTARPCRVRRSLRRNPLHQPRPAPRRP